MSPVSFIVDRWGTVVFLLWLAYQIYGPKVGLNTRFSEILDSVNGRLDKMGNRIDEFEQKQDKHISITHVMAVHDEDIDENAVESVLGDEPPVHSEEVMADDKWADEREP